MKYLSAEQVIEIHDELIQAFGGFPGIREIGLLESSIASPMMSVFGEELYETVFNKASAYLFFIARNHPFFDGNKRTAAATALSFLRANGQFPQYDTNDFLEFIVLVAEGKKDIESI